MLRVNKVVLSYELHNNYPSILLITVNETLKGKAKVKL